MAYIDENLCTGCGICLDACARGAISLEGYSARIDPELCTDCGRCVDVCVTEAIVAPEVPVDSASSVESGTREIPTPILAAGRPDRGTGRGLGSGRARGPGGGRGRGVGRPGRCGSGLGSGRGRGQPPRSVQRGRQS